MELGKINQLRLIMWKITCDPERNYHCVVKSDSKLIAARFNNRKDAVQWIIENIKDKIVTENQVNQTIKFEDNFISKKDDWTENYVLPRLILIFVATIFMLCYLIK